MVQIDEESKFENKDLTKDEIITAYHYSLKACYEEMKITDEKVEQLQAERDRLKAVLVKISEWGCNGQCYDLVKTLCPCCIAKQALEVDGGKD